MKKIIITGACGFIGSHLTELLVSEGFKVTAFDRYNNNQDYGWLNNSKYKKDINFVLGDIRDFDSVNNAIKNHDTVIHLAALIGIPYSYVSPLAYIKTNVEGTYNVLEATKNQNLQQAIITSTSETYGSAEYVPIDEKHRKIGQSPYAASKIAADQLAISYYQSFNLPIKILRPFNTYGPRQSTRAIIPTIIKQILNNKNKKISLGNTFPTRDFTYVKDTCNAFKKIIQSKKGFGEEINIGSGEEISVLDLSKKISKLLNHNIKIIVDKKRTRRKKSEVDRLCCDSKKIYQLVEWTPKYNMKKGLQETINWCKKNKSFLSENYHG